MIEVVKLYPFPSETGELLLLTLRDTTAGDAAAVPPLWGMPLAAHVTVMLGFE
jgi:hypothetical protein